jgi:hypothetical protein
MRILRESCEHQGVGRVSSGHWVVSDQGNGRKQQPYANQRPVGVVMRSVYSEGKANQERSVRTDRNSVLISNFAC